MNYDMLIRRELFEGNPEKKCAICEKTMLRNEPFGSCVCFSLAHIRCILSSDTSLTSHLSFKCGRCRSASVRYWNRRRKPAKRLSNECYKVKRDEKDVEKHKSSSETLNLLLQLGAKIHTVNYNQESPLYIAIRNNCLEKSKMLVKAGAAINQLTERSESLLHVACRHGDVSLVKYLLEECGAPIDMRDCIGQTEMFMAATRGSIHILDYLHSQGAELDVRTFDQRTLLHRTAWHGQVEAAQWLLDRGADPNAEDRCGWTPLHSAAYCGHIPLAALLLKYGADLDKRTDYRQTPLRLALISTSPNVKHFFRYQGGRD